MKNAAERVHVVIDFMHLYYRYLFMLQRGAIRRLTAVVNGTEVDVSNMYYALSEVEKCRKDNEKRFGPNVDICLSVCFDAPPSERKKLDENQEYKSKRTKHLTDEDIQNIGIIRQMLELAGYSVYYREGEEADDLIASLVSQYKDQFGANLIITNDSDLTVWTDTYVHVCRYKAKQGYTEIYPGNYEQLLSSEFKCSMPFNAIMLYKALCGDTADNIPGVRGFGPKAFDAAIRKLQGLGWGTAEFEGLRDIETVEYAIKLIYPDPCTEAEQAFKSLELVKPRKDLQVQEPGGMSTEVSRKAAYMDTYGFKSLV